MDLAEIRGRLDQAVYRDHAVDRMSERNITPAIIEEAVNSPDATIVRESTDARGDNCLVLGWWGNHYPLHILFGTGKPVLWVVTLWDPSDDPKSRWEADFKTRKTTGS